MPALDGLRGLAILLVIAHNAQMIDAPVMHGAAKVAEYILNIGWVGVQLFFVLSGFLITGILLDSVGRARALPHFMVRRALRIFPLYYGVLLLIFVILPAIGHQPSQFAAEAPHQIWLWLYLVNWTAPLGNHSANALPHFWSLAVEEQFYLFWPLVVLTLKTPRRVAIACLVTAVVSAASREVLLYVEHLPSDVVYQWTICRLDALALGGFAAACWRDEAWSDWIRRHARQILAITALVFVAAGAWTHGFPRANPKSMVVGYSVLAIVFGVMIYAAAWRDVHATPSDKSGLWQSMLCNPALRSVGKYSYGMYVIHKPLHDLYSESTLQRLGFDPSGSILLSCLHVAGVMAVSYGIAWLSYNLYEVRFLNLKSRFA